eukprot:7271656-Prymnesium_polylepis.1
MSMWRRQRAASDQCERNPVAIDGRGELAGYANYAHSGVANAGAHDVLPSVLRRPDHASIAVMTATVVVARQEIPMGQEVRWDYDHDPGRPFRAAMLARGVSERELDSDEYKRGRWVLARPDTGAERWAPQADFPLRTLEELGLDLEQMEADRAYAACASLDDVRPGPAVPATGTLISSTPVGASG